jgi:hypothetical protein
MNDRSDPQDDAPGASDEAEARLPHDPRVPRPDEPTRR